MSVLLNPRYNDLVFYKAPYIPPIDPSNATGTQNFDETFDLKPVISDEDNLDGKTRSD